MSAVSSAAGTACTRAVYGPPAAVTTCKLESRVTTAQPHRISSKCFPYRPEPSPKAGLRKTFPSGEVEYHCTMASVAGFGNSIL
eukprot:1854544-Karenia_brevis.AAC.1